MSKEAIKNPSVGIRPSQELINFIKSLDDPSIDLPENLLKLYQAFTQDTRTRNVCKQTALEGGGVYTDEEKKLMIAMSDDGFQGSTDLGKCLESLSIASCDEDIGDDFSNVETLRPDEKISKNKARQMRAKQRQKEASKLTLNLFDLKWLHKYLTDAREIDTSIPFLHELVEGSQLVLPANEITERNPELEARCKLLKRQQDDQAYRQMTKNVDCTRTYEPEETISYQGKRSLHCHWILNWNIWRGHLNIIFLPFSVKQINRQLIAVLQFIFSVAAGFAFGFIGIELIVGNLDFGFRLLLGIICSLVIALAEIYFLAKKLNEEIDEAEQAKKPSNSTSSKVENIKPHND